MEAIYSICSRKASGCEASINLISENSNKEMEMKKSARSVLICRTCKVTKGTYIIRFITSLSALKDDLREKRRLLKGALPRCRGRNGSEKIMEMC